MSTFHNIICEQLEANGWRLLFNTSAVALKTYDTIVGKREAHVFFQEWDGAIDDNEIEKETNLRLSAEFNTEGRNILEANSVLIKKISTTDEVRVVAQKFIDGVDVRISNAKIVKLANSKSIYDDNQDEFPVASSNIKQALSTEAWVRGLNIIPINEAELRLMERMHNAASYVSSASDDQEEIQRADQQLIMLDKLFDAATVTIDEDDKFVQKEPEQSILANDDQGSPCF